MFCVCAEIDNGFYTVKFDSLLLKDAMVEADAIIPPLREDDAVSSDSDLDEPADGDDAVYAKGVFGCAPPPPCQSQSESIFETLPICRR